MRVLTCEEQKRFTEYLLRDMDPCKFGVLLALLTGLRIGEVCALKWEDISLENKVIFVRHTMQRLKNLNPASEERTRIITGVPKSGRSVRMIPMNQDIETVSYTHLLHSRTEIHKFLSLFFFPAIKSLCQIYVLLNVPQNLLAGSYHWKISPVSYTHLETMLQWQ